MTIRNKLILSSSVMLILVLSIGVASIWSLMSWQDSASLVELDRSRTNLVDQIRTGMNRQVSFGTSHLSGGEAELALFSETEVSLATKLAELRALATLPEEIDHIQGVEETMVELSWVVKGILERIDSSSAVVDLASSVDRLQEISEEISDDVAVLHRYYRRQVDDSIARANSAGKNAAWVISVGIGLALLQLFTMIFVSQVWLVKPIEKVSEVTKQISQGDLDSRLDMPSGNEWGALAQSINEMAVSLTNLQQELKTKERLAAVGEVAAYTAHNIRNPLAGIRAAAQVAIGELQEDDNQTREVFADIIEAVDRMERWIKSLMNFAAPLDLKASDCTIGKLIKEIAGILAEKARLENVKLSVVFDSENINVKIDEELIGQALANIITNGIESGTDRVEIDTRLNQSSSGREEVLILIKDFGRGIDREIEPKIFHAFTTNKSGGTGLGLAQAKKIVEFHGGRLTIASERGNGTIVTIALFTTQ